MEKERKCEIGKRIKERREKLGLTQFELAQRMGYTSKAAVCKVERGDDNITMERIIRFSRALNCTESYLIGVNASKAENDTFEKHIKQQPTKEELNFLFLLSQLNDDGLNEALKRIEELTQLDKYKKV